VTPFVVRIEVIAALVTEKAWRERLSQTRSTREAGQVIAEFCKAKGIKVKETRLK
jgi:hypothetical protein